jgi:DNA-binding response OmpR family regulator
MAGESILVVEDTELLRRIYTDKLSQEGYRVFQAADGLECLNIARAESVDLILLDLVMPRMSGIESLEALKRDPRTKSVPVIILSNLGQESDIQRCMDIGAVDYLIKNSAKPVDVTAKIRTVLDQAPKATAQSDVFRLQIKDREADADAFAEQARLTKRFWCPSCEVELTLEMVPQPGRIGWYDAHLVCPACGREF